MSKSLQTAKWTLRENKMILHSLKELFRKWRWTAVFTLNLSFGFIGFISLLSFQSAIEQKILLNSKQILTADLSINARKKISNNDIETAKKIIKELNITIEDQSYFVELLAMLKTDKKSQLVSVKAIDSKYPFYGDLELSVDKKKYSENKNLLKGDQFLAYSELREMLDLSLDQKLTLGDIQVQVKDFITKDTTQTFKIGGLAPKIFINSETLQKTNLIKFGSTFSESYLFKLKEPYDKEILQKKLISAIQDPAIQIETSESAAKDSARQLGFLTDFLNLIAIISILLSALGTYFLFQVFIYKKLKDYAIFRTLGFSLSSLRKMFFYQLLILSLMVTLISYAGAVVFTPILTYFFEKTLSLYLQVSVPHTVVVLSFFIICITCVLVAAPFLMAIEKLSTAKLFNEQKLSLFIDWKYRIPQILSVFLVGLLSVYLTKSLFLSALFLGTLIVVTAIIFLLGYLGIKLLEIIHFKNWLLKYSIKSLARKKASSIIIFCCIALSSLLLNLLPQIKSSIEAEFILSDRSNLPSMFIIDIQEEQIDQIKQILSEKNLKMEYLSPLIRARILKVNDLAFERKVANGSFVTREEETEARFRNRGINLTYRSNITKTETILEGIPLQEYHGDIPGISIEYKYAERLGLKIGDVLTFDIQGVEVQGKIVNFRKVRWISFQPNFFISFADGPLNDSPKSYIGIVNGLNENSTKNLITVLTSKISNLSIIDVRQLVKDVLSMADQMSFSIQLMSFLTMITGFIILSSIIYLQLYERRWELNLLKILGVSFWDRLKYILIEFNLITLLAASLGGLLSLGISYGLIKYLFETGYQIDPLSLILTIMCFVVISIIICLLISYKILSSKSGQILKEG